MFEKRVRAVKGIDFQFKTAQDEKYFIDGEVDVVNFKNETEFVTFVSLGYFEDAKDADIGPPELQVIYPEEVLELSGNLEFLDQRVGPVSYLDHPGLPEGPADPLELSHKISSGPQEDFTEASLMLAGLGWKK